MSGLDELNRIIGSGLCNRCGTCVGLSGGAIQFMDKTGKYLPKILSDPDAETSQRILNACPGKSFDFPDYKKRLFPPENDFHIYLGSFSSIYVGYSTDVTIRQAGASGGVLTAILLWLLEKGMIDGAVVLDMSADEPWMTQPVIATTRQQIRDAAQSKYTISSVNELLPLIEKFEGKLAFVGLPGQVQSIRKLQAMNDPAVRPIKYIFGPFYGNTLHFGSVIDLLSSYGEKDYRQIEKLYFRYGEWPGYTRIELRNGRIIQLPKFHANYLIPFHIMKNSLLCTDFTNEFTDISGGDAWAPVYEERAKGYSMVIARSSIGQSILDRMMQEGVLLLKPVSVDEAIAMHSHGYDLKKRGAFIRIRFRKMLGKPVPDYGYEISGFSFTRYAMEVFIVSMFWLCSTHVARWLIRQIPPAIVGKAFERFRKWWKKATHHIKRENLGK